MAPRRALLLTTDVVEDKAFGQLPAPTRVRQAEELAEVLSDPAIGAYDVRFLPNSPAFDANLAIAEHFTEAGEGDLVLLYISGFAIRDDSGELYLVARNTRREHLGATATSVSFIRQQMDRCRSSRKLIVLDCSFAEVVAATTEPRAEAVLNVTTDLEGPGTAILTATSRLDYAYQAGPAEADVPVRLNTGARPAFTRILTEGLRTGAADLNGDGQVDLAELYAYLFEQMNNDAPGRNPKLRDLLTDKAILAFNPQGPQNAPGLPPYLGQDLRSPLATVRLAAVSDLLALARSPAPIAAEAARTALAQLTGDDSRQVIAAAEAALQALSDLQRRRDPGPRPMVMTLTGHKKAARAVAFDGTGMLVSGSDDGQVNLWDPTRRDHIPVRSFKSPVTTIAYNANGQLVATGHQDGTARLLYVKTLLGPSRHRLIVNLRSNGGHVRAAAFDPGGQLLVIGDGSTARLWSVTDARPAFVADLQGHHLTVNGVAFSPDGTLLATAGDDRYVNLWDVSRYRLITTLHKHGRPVHAVAFGPDGALLASGSGDGTVTLWDTSSHASITTLRCGADAVNAVAFSPDGRVIAVGCDDRTVQLWEVAEHRLITVLAQHTREVLAVAFSPDGRLLATGSGDAAIILWDTGWLPPGTQPTP